MNRLFISIALLFNSGIAFAANEEEFFNAAMNLEAKAPQTNAADAAAQVAASVPTETAGNAVQKATESLQNLGGSIGDSVSSITHANPFATKLLVALILVMISIVIIIVMILLAKKFVFKKHIQVPEEYEEEEYEDFNENDIDQDEIETVEDDANANKPRESHTMIPPKSKIEPEPKKVQQNSETVESAMKVFLKVTE